MKSRYVNLFIGTIIIIILYGNLLYHIATYYFNIIHPSWPLWISLYLFTGTILFHFASQNKLKACDLFFIAFIGYTITSFLLFGESSKSEFWTRIITICMVPYLCGRVVGRYIDISFLDGLKILFILYVLLLVVKFHGNLYELTKVERAIFFVSDEYWDQPGGGNADAFNIGITFGSAWIVAFTFLLSPFRNTMMKVGNLRSHQLKGMVVVLPFLLMIVGSRTSIISAAICAIILAYIAYGRVNCKVVLVLCCIPPILFFLYRLMPEQRRIFLDEFINFVTLQSDVHSVLVSCDTQSQSVLGRVTIMREAILELLSSPIIGVGASNYGLRYCGPSIEFASPHNVFMHIAAEGGLVGLSLFALILLALIRKFWCLIRSRTFLIHPNVVAVFSLWLFVLVQQQFLGNLYYDLQFYLLSGLLVSVLNRRDLVVFSFFKHGYGPVDLIYA